MGTIKKFVNNHMKNNVQDLLDTSVGNGRWYMDSELPHPVRDALGNEKLRAKLFGNHHPEIKKGYGFK